MPPVELFTYVRCFDRALQFLYPFGATLNCIKPAVAVLSSGSVSFPLNRPVLAFTTPGPRGGGKLAVLGSSHMFSDQYLDKEENSKIMVGMWESLWECVRSLNLTSAVPIVNKS